MSGFLITPSLYSAWKYWKDSEDSGKEEILDVLNKTERGKSPAMQTGIDFENAIRYVCDYGIPEPNEVVPFDPEKPVHVQGIFAWENPCVLEAAEIVKGGMWQQRVSKELDGDLLYGIADVIRRNTIFDIKRVNQYDLGKYETSIQHLVYMYATGIPNFDYVISDGHEVYVETYHWEARSLETLKERISEMKGSLLSDDEMRWAFQTHWTCKKDANREANESVQTPGQISGTEILKSFEDVRNRNINRLKRDMVHQQEFT